jgi:hypothetical protein
MPVLEILRKMLSEVRRQSSITRTVINGRCHGSVNIQLTIGSEGFCVQICGSNPAECIQMYAQSWEAQQAEPQHSGTQVT